MAQHPKHNIVPGIACRRLILDGHRLDAETHEAASMLLIEPLSCSSYRTRLTLLPTQWGCCLDWWLDSEPLCTKISSRVLQLWLPWLSIHLVAFPPLILHLLDYSPPASLSDPWLRYEICGIDRGMRAAVVLTGRDPCRPLDDRPWAAI